LYNGVRGLLLLLLFRESLTLPGLNLIPFVSPSVLLRRLQVDPDLASVSHVFVDEVHERDLNTDFMLIILKELLQRRPSLKLVLMSATLNAERFSEFFGGCPTVSIPGRAQPVQEYR
jgi:HrpA-like RNA helicase